MTKPYVSENPKALPMVKLAGWLFLIVAVVFTITYFWYPRSVKRWSRYTGGTTAPFGVRQSVSNGRPRLQIDEIADYKAYLESQAKLLEEYGWVDQPKGVARIPIERAMDRLVEQGIPSRNADQRNATLGVAQ